MLVDFQVSQELKRYQRPIKLDNKNPYYGAQRRLIYYLQNKNGYKTQSIKI